MFSNLDFIVVYAYVFLAKHLDGNIANESCHLENKPQNSGVFRVCGFHFSSFIRLSSHWRTFLLLFVFVASV